MIETIGLGAGSYPEQPENETKCYEFTIQTLERLTGYVYADSREKAERYIKNKEWEEIEDGKTLEVIEIERLEEEK